MRKLKLAWLAGLLAVAPLAWAQAPDEAKAHYLLAVEKYKHGDFAQAIDEFKAADQIRPSPALSFNIAQCYEKLADLANAKMAYLEYLQRAPDAEDRASVQNTLASIDAKLAQPPKETVVLVTPSPSAQVETTVAKKPNYVLPGVLLGVGVLGLGAGGLLNGLSQGDVSSMHNNVNGRTQVQSLHDGAQNLWYGAIAGYAVGGALAVAGAVLAAIEMTRQPHPIPNPNTAVPPAPAPSPAGGGAGLFSGGR